MEMKNELPFIISKFLDFIEHGNGRTPAGLLNLGKHQIMHRRPIPIPWGSDKGVTSLAGIHPAISVSIETKLCSEHRCVSRSYVCCGVSFARNFYLGELLGFISSEKTGADRLA
jgi:hypothetical protein